MLSPWFRYCKAEIEDNFEQKEVRPDRVVFLATSHYSGNHYPLYDGKPFIATRKRFETPLGSVVADQEFMNLLEEQSEATGCSFSDRAHRSEHSIELHLIFLQYLWSHPFKIVPILVGSLEELYYKEDGDVGQKVLAMASLLREHSGDENSTLFLISGDLSHVGRKFGDPDPASSLFEKIRSFDRDFLAFAARGDGEGMLELMKQDYVPYRMCGFSPLYTALLALEGIQGRITSYELWDEREGESAVTYGSLLFRSIREGRR